MGDELGRPTCKVTEHVAAVGIELAGVVVVQAPADVMWGPAGPGTAFVPRLNRKGMFLLARLRLQCEKHWGSHTARSCMPFSKATEPMQREHLGREASQAGNNQAAVLQVLDLTVLLCMLCSQCAKAVA